MKKDWIAASYLLVITLFLSIDPLLDLMGGEGLVHVSVEIFFGAFTLSGLIVILLQIRRDRKARRQLEHDLHRAREDAANWRSEAEEHLKGLGEAIDHQFQRWELSPAERDVGFLLLKGLSHKEIAQVRATSERTVRQQSREVYRKSGLSGRAVLSAWFLEDLLLPGQSPRDPESHDAE